MYETFLKLKRPKFCLSSSNYHPNEKWCEIYPTMDKQFKTYIIELSFDGCYQFIVPISCTKFKKNIYSIARYECFKHFFIERSLHNNKTGRIPKNLLTTKETIFWFLLSFPLKSKEYYKSTNTFQWVVSIFQKFFWWQVRKYVAFYRLSS